MRPWTFSTTECTQGKRQDSDSFCAEICVCSYCDLFILLGHRIHFYMHNVYTYAKNVTHKGWDSPPVLWMFIDTCFRILISVPDCSGFNFTAQNMYSDTKSYINIRIVGYPNWESKMWMYAPLRWKYILEHCLNNKQANNQCSRDLDALEQSVPWFFSVFFFVLKKDPF